MRVRSDRGAKSVLIASAIAVALSLGGGCPAGAPIDGGNDGATGQLVFQNLDAALLSVSGTSPSGIYAVGADPANVDGGPYILHYNGQTWRRLRNSLSGALWWISVETIDGAFYLAGTGGKVVRFTPGADTFEPLSTPGDDIVFGVWGTTASSLWAVGGDLENEDTGGFIWFFNGAQWQVQDLSAVLPGGVPTLYKVWGRSASDVYAVGRLGVVLHFDGNVWSRVTTDTTRTLFTVHGNDSEVAAVGGFGDAVILEQSGDSFVNRASAGTPQMNGVFIPPDGRGVSAGNEGAIAFQTDAGWEVQSIGFGTQRDFHATWVDSEGGIWAVGGNLSAQLNSGILGYIGTRTIGTSVSQ